MTLKKHLQHLQSFPLHELENQDKAAALLFESGFSAREVASFARIDKNAVTRLYSLGETEFLNQTREQTINALAAGYDELVTYLNRTEG